MFRVAPARLSHMVSLSPDNGLFLLMHNSQMPRYGYCPREIQKLPLTPCRDHLWSGREPGALHIQGFADTAAFNIGPSDEKRPPFGFVHDSAHILSYQADGQQVEGAE